MNEEQNFAEQEEQERPEFQALLLDERVNSFLGRLGTYHPYTRTHSVRVGRLSTELGIANGVSGQQLAVLGYGALLHDVGKLYIPLEILDKPGKLNDKEQRAMRAHTRLGFLELENFPYEDVRRIVVRHHEFKSSAYPRCREDRRLSQHTPVSTRSERKRREDNITIEGLAQMVAAADMFDALASARSYKPALPLLEVERIMQTQYRGSPQYIRQILEIGRTTSEPAKSI